MRNLQALFMVEGEPAEEAVLVSAHQFLAAALDRVAYRLQCRSWPLLLTDSWGQKQDDAEHAVLGVSARLGKLLLEGIGDAVWIRNPVLGRREAVELAYDLLQAAGLRVSKAEYVACPSCGRTMFNLEQTTARIRARTQHLKGLKIAIMGCIVNGPGEMADADFGYVGSGPGRVQLFVGRECVARAIPEEEAEDRLVDLIRQHGKWSDPR
jgi:(E)-4-hydroxy-3-methylbut-2-enyl-diphosphate synthase